MSHNKVLMDLFDEEGFVTDPEVWDRDLALALAAEHGIHELTEMHWRLIDVLRDKYLESGSLPWISHECREVGLDEDCFQDLFGGVILAWKIAGLPNPGMEARLYMTNESGNR
ncbi:MAG: TusE/DsrC/DsvC family sulfur relay protein [Candidatus Thiodiazotropha sp.]